MALVAATGLLIAGTSPAEAEAGAGTSTGEFTTFQYNDRNLEVPLCLEVTAATLVLDNVGTFTATNATGTSVYEGRTTATVVMESDYYFNPAGTFSDNLCTVPAVVRASISVVSVGTPTVGTSVSCSGTGSYGREGENAQVTTAVTNSSTTNHSSPTTATATGAGASCTVTQNAVTRTSLLPVQLTFTGLQQPCLDPPLPQPCQSTTVNGVPVHTEWVGTYSET